MIIESEHTYREKDPDHIIVQLTLDNWDDVVEWTHSETYTDDDDGTSWLLIPNGDYDAVYASLGWWIEKNGGQWVACNAEEWGEPDDFGTVSSIYVKVEG